MRRVLLLGVIALLAGCNTVQSEKPWFAPDDAAGAPPLRPGVWSFPVEGKCRFTERAPIERWPECANGAVVRERDILQLSRAGRHLEWQFESYVLAAGDPRIIQIYSSKDDGSGSTIPKFYEYGGVQPLSLDSAGRITRLGIWPTLCDGETLAYAPGDTPMRIAADGLVPEHPLPPEKRLTPLQGLHMKEGGQGCWADSREAIVSAARQSRRNPLPIAHWVRDGDS